MAYGKKKKMSGGRGTPTSNRDPGRPTSNKKRKPKAPKNATGMPFRR